MKELCGGMIEDFEQSEKKIFDRSLPRSVRQVHSRIVDIIREQIYEVEGTTGCVCIAFGFKK